jgi:uncharacterized protein with HEPN domain
MSKNSLNLYGLLEAIQKIEDYTREFDNSTHDYFGIDADEVWSIIQKHLLPLKSDIQKLSQEA